LKGIFKQESFYGGKDSTHKSEMPDKQNFAIQKSDIADRKYSTAMNDIRLAIDEKLF